METRICPHWIPKDPEPWYIPYIGDAEECLLWLWGVLRKVCTQYFVFRKVW